MNENIDLRGIREQLARLFQLVEALSAGGGVTLPIAESDVTNLVSDLAGKETAGAAAAAQTAAEAYADSLIEDAINDSETAKAPSQNAVFDALAALSVGGLPIATAAGTANAITADYTPDITLTDKMLVAFVASAANSASPVTFAPDGLTAHEITQKGGVSLSIGHIPAALYVCIVEYNLANTRWELLNPYMTDRTLGFTDNTDNNVVSTRHGFAPKSPADATKFLNGAATPDYAQVKETDLVTTDETTADSTTTKHGFLKKLDNNAFDFMNGVGDWAQPFSYALRSYNLLGGSVLAEPLLGSIMNMSATFTLSNQVVRFHAVYLPQAATITGVKFYQSTQGNYTSNNYNGVGLYSIAGGTLTLVASSIDDGNIWKAAGQSWSSKAFSSTYPAAAGIYFIAIVYSRSAETTAPILGAFPLTVNIGIVSFDFTNSVKLNSSLAAQTALPSPTQLMSGLSASTANPYLALY